MPVDLPYDVIYLIYMKTDDYCTANNFWFLNKFFYQNYMRKYNKSYHHKFNILFKNMTTFLSLLPETNLDLETDLSVFQLITTQCLQKEDKIMLKHDIKFFYDIYKSFFLHQLSILTPLGYKVCDLMSNLLLIQGSNYIDRVSIAKFNKNKVRVHPPIKNKTQYLDSIIHCARRCSYSFIQTQIEKLQIFFVDE